MLISVIAIVIPLLFIKLSDHQRHLCTHHQYSNHITITIATTNITTTAINSFIILNIIFNTTVIIHDQRHFIIAMFVSLFS